MKHLLAVACVAASAACADISAPAITSVEIQLIADVLFPGDTTSLTAVVQDAKGNYLVSPTIEWSSSDSTILHVTAQGKAIAVRPGSADVILRHVAATAKHNIRVEAGFVAIEAGPAATCGLLHSGELYCWGEMRAIGAYRQPYHVLQPRRVPTDLRFSRFSVGSNHTCAVTFDRRAYCWGSGTRGEIGNGLPGSNSDVPLAVAGDLTFVDVSAGWEHACGLTPDGIAYCWGRGWEGQLGTGAFQQKSAPVQVQTELRFKQLQAAGSNTCALTHLGETYCWGERRYLGVDTLTSNQATPFRVPVPAIDVFDAANDDPCGITPDHQLYCWTDKVELVAAAGAVSAVTVGGSHVCITQVDARVMCFGGNASGQLGTGNTSDSTTPVAPAGNLKFVQITAGGSHTCGITDTGAAYCWGANKYGQLGNGSRGSASTAARILLTRD